MLLGLFNNIIGCVGSFKIYAFLDNYSCYFQLFSGHVELNFFL